jgi:hypothetical protein
MVSKQMLICGRKNFLMLLSSLCLEPSSVKPARQSQLLRTVVLLQNYTMHLLAKIQIIQICLLASVNKRKVDFPISNTS